MERDPAAVTMAPRIFIAALLVMFLVSAQAARPLQPAAGAVQLQAADSTLTAPVFSAVVSSALRRLMEPEKPNKPNSAKAVDSAAAAFKRLGSTAGH